MFKKTLATTTLFFASVGLAAAGGFGAIGGIGVEAGGWAGTGSGYASSATTGGSMAQGAVNHTGFSQQFTSNEGGGYAGAGAAIGSDGVVTYTAGGSHAANVSSGYVQGAASGSTAGAVGTDYSSEAWGSFDTAGFGAGIVIGGGFGSFGSFGGGAIPQ